ncbi:hypothetical protein QE364_003135 [Nocardioides zeae]|uniref:Uncharacterized protein n=1 Tax=Nocardioides zeae TaxID=1457234 RepID=A0ACC6IKY7_9ACTN|nr:hypothetical protein [Nocardioides zeae]MDR6211411.1 hypothetical protein [Nocardioides zeae]
MSRVRRTRSVLTATAAAVLLLASGCSDGGGDGDSDGADGSSGSPSTAPTALETTLGPDQVLEDFCTAAGLVAFMETGEDLRLWAQSMSEVERPTDLPDDAAAGLALLQEYAAQVPTDAVAAELEQPDYPPEQIAQLEAWSRYLEGCPQVTNPPQTIEPSAEPTED